MILFQEKLSLTSLPVGTNQSGVIKKQYPKIIQKQLGNFSFLLYQNISLLWLSFHLEIRNRL